MDDAPRPGALAARDVGELLQAVVADVGGSLDLWSVDLWAFSDDADTLECRAYWCRDPATAQSGDCVGAVVGLDQSHDLRRLVLAAEVVERHLGGDLSPADTAALTQAGFTSRIDVPLLAGAEVLGVLSLAEKRAVRRLSPEDRARLGTLARMAAAVLRATRLYEAESERAERLTTLLVAGHGLPASLSPQKIVVAVREAAARLIGGVECAAEVVLRQDDGTFVRVAPAGEAGAVWRADAVARQAADLGRPEQGRTADGRARLVLPLSGAGRTAGYLELTASLRRRFRESEVELASLLAGQTAAALDRARAFSALQSRSATDTLTGLYSRWYFYERLYAEVARARRYREPLALVIAELDGEEELARSRGPAFRDAVLVAVARLLLTSLRDKVDVACRLGGGRFALLLPNTSSGPDAAGLVAERIRARAEATRLSDDELGALGRFTMSLGVAGFPDAAEDADDLASAAEERLARARAAGGDRIEPPLPEPEEEDEEGGAPEDAPA
jgi:diguanylate cyclase (GGDEF)-like protein